MTYDVIIAGGSFGGLAVAGELNGKVLLIDKDDIGTHQTSACATLVDSLRKLGCEDSILQTFDSIYINVLGKDIVLKFDYYFCTFDYQKFCQIMLKSGETEVIKAEVKGVKDNYVITDKDEFEGRILVDATGWRATLANSLRTQISADKKQHRFPQINSTVLKIGANQRLYQRQSASKKRLSFGLETIHPYPNDKLMFYWNPKILRKGVTWIFPAATETRFGIGSYTGETKLKRKLEEFLSDYKLQIHSLHGGYLPHKLGEPTAGHIFLVGDSAGQCLPLTGEGIRPALYFGQRCGRLIQKIIGKSISLEEGFTEYRSFVLKHASEYALLFRLQKFFTNIPDFLTVPILKFLKTEKIFPPVAERYRKAAVLEDRLEMVRTDRMDLAERGQSV